MPTIGPKELLPVVGKLVPPTLPACLTLRVNCVELVWLVPTTVPTTVIVVAAAGVENVVAIVRMLVNVGAASGTLNPQVAPTGRFWQERVTSWVGPWTRVTVMVFDPSLPCVTVIPLEAETLNEKLDAATVGTTARTAISVTIAVV